MCYFISKQQSHSSHGYSYRDCQKTLRCANVFFYNRPSVQSFMPKIRSSGHYYGKRYKSAWTSSFWFFILREPLPGRAGWSEAEIPVYRGIENWRLQIEYLSMSLAQRRRSSSARACAACAPRVAPSFLKWKEFLKYSIFNRKYSILTKQRNYSNTIFLPQNAQK